MSSPTTPAVQVITPGTLGEADAIARRKNEVMIHAITDPFAMMHVQVASVPEGRSLQALWPFVNDLLPRPRRRVGTSTVHTTESFIALVARFASERHTVLFASADPAKPTVTAVFNDHEAGPHELVNAPNGHLTGFGDHRAVLALRVSEEWKAWSRLHGKEMDQVEFAAVLQDRIGDLVAVDVADARIAETLEMLGARYGSPQAIVSLSRGIEINAKVAVKNVVTLEDGACQLSYVEEHTQAGSAVRVPTLFYLGIPVFYAGAPYQVPVRIRYRMKGPAILWSLHLHRMDKVFDDAFARVLEQVRTETTPTLPLYIGEP